MIRTSCIGHRKHRHFFQHWQIEHVNTPMWILKKQIRCQSLVALKLWSNYG